LRGVGVVEYGEKSSTLKGMPVAGFDSQNQI